MAPRNNTTVCCKGNECVSDGSMGSERLDRQGEDVAVGAPKHGKEHAQDSDHCQLVGWNLRGWAPKCLLSGC